jgi:molecular chaperone GrpE (heat shock protein)
MEESKTRQETKDKQRHEAMVKAEAALAVALSKRAAEKEHALKVEQDMVQKRARANKQSGGLQPSAMQGVVKNLLGFRKQPSGLSSC